MKCKIKEKSFAVFLSTDLTRGGRISLGTDTQTQGHTDRQTTALPQVSAASFLPHSYRQDSRPPCSSSPLLLLWNYGGNFYTSGKIELLRIMA
ncbi:hypothetical protein E2C01_034020 [Portunus trituberculatus]|uniref:Uncharacterized protein n=1 Tax=Portunus trituberculatus TaxID=210409 RepID=A0A5B7F5T9_PORTR|nr:hypothetical protein [Portunus trituberculatus]